MTKQTLRFSSLEEMAQFVKSLPGGYVLNTMSLTLTATLPEANVDQAQQVQHHPGEQNGDSWKFALPMVGCLPLQGNRNG